MKAKETILKIWLNACVCFTVTTFVILATYWLLVGLSDGMRPLALILIFPFSLCFSAANMLLRYGKMQKALAVVLHYILTVGGVYLFLYWPMRAPGSTTGGAFLFFVLLTLVYILIMGVIAVFKGRSKRLSRDSKDYKNVYENKK